MKSQVAQTNNTVSNSEVSTENQETSGHMIEDAAQALIAVNSEAFISEEKSDPIIQGM